MKNNKIETIEKQIKELQDELQILKEREETNAFIKSGDIPDIMRFSEEWFGDSSAINIMTIATPIDRPELYGKSFYVYNKFKVEVIELSDGAHAIAIYKNK